MEGAEKHVGSLTFTRWMWKAVECIVNSDPCVHALCLAWDDLKVVLSHNKLKLFGEVCVEVLENVVLGSAKKGHTTYF